jgi:hypothetical protein
MVDRLGSGWAKSVVEGINERIVRADFNRIYENVNRIELSEQPQTAYLTAHEGVCDCVTEAC